MSLAPRDQEAYDAVAARSFGGAWVLSFALEMQARRLTLVLYGAVRGEASSTYAATLTCFGTSAVRIDNQLGAFPQSIAVAALDLSYDDGSDEATLRLGGREDWTLVCNFEGLAYDERPALITSLGDDL